MPKIAEIEYTPNPHAVKFILKEPVISGFPRTWNRSDAGYDHPLAENLFALLEVESVFAQDKWVTITKKQDVSWSELLPKLAPPIRKTPSAMSSADEAPPTPPGEETPELARIREVLEQTIFPALAADGGGMQLVAYRDQTLYIRYQGACSTCPAGATGTLWAIENILRKEIDPSLRVMTV